MVTHLRTVLVSLFIWSFISLTLLPLFLIYFLIWIVVFPFDRHHAITHYFTILWTRLYLTINPGWRLIVENRNKIDRKKAYVLIANHQSIIDIALLLQLRIHFKWVSKIELASVPFVGWVIWMNNHIVVKRGDRDSVAEMAKACKKVLDKGISVFMFPEGTRTTNGHMLPLKEGAFILARTNNIPILPVVIDGAGEALPRHGFLFKLNQKFTVRVLDEIPVETVQMLDLESLMDYSAGVMTSELDLIRNNFN